MTSICWFLVLSRTIKLMTWTCCKRRKCVIFTDQHQGWHEIINSHSTSLMWSFPTDHENLEIYSFYQDYTLWPLLILRMTFFRVSNWIIVYWTSRITMKREAILIFIVALVAFGSFALDTQKVSKACLLRINSQWSYPFNCIQFSIII